jgi:hypothetical protein
VGVVSERPTRVRLGGDLFHPQVPPGAVNVTRQGGRRWSNPYPVKAYGRANAIRLYREHLAAHPELVEAARRELAGKDLACWCRPGQACHADLLLEVANRKEGAA